MGEQFTEGNVALLVVNRGKNGDCGINRGETCGFTGEGKRNGA
jgi:hypothetical protein